MLNSGSLTTKTKLYILLALPSFLNDFTNIFISHYETWLVFDYTIRALQLVAVFLCIKNSKLTWKDVGLGKASPIRVLNYAIALGFLAYFVGTNLLPFLKTVLPANRLATIPYDPQSPLFTFDMTFGLLLVGITEEVVSRGLGFTVFKEKYGVSSAYFFSSIIFGLMHWSNGLPGVINSMVIGLIYCVAPHRTGTVWATIAAHTVYNILYYKAYVF